MRFSIIFYEIQCYCNIFKPAGSTPESAVSIGARKLRGPAERLSSADPMKHRTLGGSGDC